MQGKTWKIAFQNTHMETFTCTAKKLSNFSLGSQTNLHHRICSENQTQFNIPDMPFCIGLPMLFVDWITNSNCIDGIHFEAVHDYFTSLQIAIPFLGGFGHDEFGFSSAPVFSLLSADAHQSVELKVAFSLAFPEMDFYTQIYRLEVPSVGTCLFCAYFNAFDILKVSYWRKQKRDWKSETSLLHNSDR